MTQILSYTIAHYTGPSLMLKANNQPYKFFWGFAFSWVNVVKSCKILTLKVNFLWQKLSESFHFFFIEQYQFRSTYFVIDSFDNFNFYSTLFSKMKAVFWRNLNKCTQYLKGLVIDLEHKGRPCKMCDSVRQKLGHTNNTSSR